MSADAGAVGRRNEAQGDAGAGRAGRGTGAVTQPSADRGRAR